MRKTVGLCDKCFYCTEQIRVALIRWNGRSLPHVVVELLQGNGYRLRQITSEGLANVMVMIWGERCDRRCAVGWVHL